MLKSAEYQMWGICTHNAKYPEKLISDLDQVGPILFFTKEAADKHARDSQLFNDYDCFVVVPVFLTVGKG